VIDDLRARVRATRWPDAPDDAGWSLGTDLGYLRELAEYWADGFDWGAQEAVIARLPHFRATLDGLGIHVVHARAVDRSRPVVPLLLNHGWPDSFWRYLKVIPLLTDPGSHGGDPADAFDVIVPDMPGFGYSDRPVQPLNSIDVAARWAELMTILGYERFVTAGGDIGSGVSRYLALDQPERVVAVHRMDAGMPFISDRSELTAEEHTWLDDAARWGGAEGAYAAMHRTKPQTVAFGLTDSPVGLAAWIVEKLRSWSDCDGDIERCFTKDEILTLVTQYWVTGTIGSSMRMYNANAAIPPEQLARRVEVPSGFSIFPADIVRPPRAILERTANVTRATEPPRGGHFAPFEQPELYVQELREFFRPYRAALTA
jgi:pimeloyl-ACP methyl ester carboxylesterase